MIVVKNLKKTYTTPIKTGNIFKDIFNRHYTTHTALDDISFEIGDNELVGLLGPNGAGKTTIMKILAGILYPTHGDISVVGFTPFDKKSDYLKQITFIMGQKMQMLWELPAVDTFRLNKEIYEVSDNAYRKTMNELVDLLDVSTIIDKPVKTLSLGQRMRVELIAALIHRPKVLFLDEPTIGLDIFAQSAIISFIKQYQKHFKATILLTSHYMKDVQQLAQRVILIDEGKNIFDGSLNSLIDTYSSNKSVSILLTKEINKKDLKIPEEKIISYQYPQLKLTLRKEELEKYLPTLLKTLEYADISIENESIEEIIKQSFISSQKTKLPR